MRIFVLALVFLTSTASLAADDPVIADFIQSIATKTYDCPADEHIDKVDQLLTAVGTSSKQKHRLATHKTHWLICRGEMQQAESRLNELLSEMDAEQYSHRYALYQLGFILDVNEDQKRCGFYTKARDLAEPFKDDVYLSARLGLITVCQQQDTGSKLGALYALLEDYSQTQDSAAMAHIHNNIGLMYGSIGQNVLAAEQYEKVFELGKQVYEEKNQLAALLSAITAYSASGDFDKVFERLETLQKANAAVNTPWSNVTLHLQLARYYFRTGKLEQLEASLKKWQVFLQQVNHPQFLQIHRWYQTRLCIEHNDAECVQAFLADQELETPKVWAQKNRDYLDLMVRAYLFLGDFEQAKIAFNNYSDQLLHSIYQQQASGKVLGVANLQAQIINLEEQLDEAQHSRQMFYVGMLVLVLVFAAAVIFWLMRRVGILTYDAETGLLDSESLIKKLESLVKSSPDKTNIFVIFQIDNLTQIASSHGETARKQVLEQLAMELQNITRIADILGRVANNQLFICLTEVDESYETSLIARIEKSLQQILVKLADGRQVSVELSRSDYISNEKVTDGRLIIQELQQAMRL